MLPTCFRFPSQNPLKNPSKIEARGLLEALLGRPGGVQRASRGFSDGSANGASPHGAKNIFLNFARNCLIIFFSGEFFTFARKFIKFDACFCWGPHGPILTPAGPWARPRDPQGRPPSAPPPRGPSGQTKTKFIIFCKK